MHKLVLGQDGGFRIKFTGQMQAGYQNQTFV